MLISGFARRDAGTFFETDASGGSEGADTTTSEEAAGAAMTPAQLQAELDNTRKALRLANKEAADRRKKLDEIAAADQARAAAELSETQRAAARADAAEAALTQVTERHRKATIRAAVLLAARDQNLFDVEDALRLADLSGVVLNDETDAVTGALEAVKALVKARPYLVKTEKPAAPNINSGAGGQPQALSPEALAARKRQSGEYVPF